MPIYPLMLPLFAAVTLIGALVGWTVWRNAGLSGRRGALVVAPAGFLGPLLTMVPMEACTFEPERTGLDIAVGIVAFTSGAAVLIAATAWIGRALSKPGGWANLDDRAEAGSFRGGAAAAMALLLPTLAVLAVFLYWPLFETLRLSTQLTRRGNPIERFSCVDNYTELLGPTAEWWLLVPLAALLVTAVGAELARRADKVGSGLLAPRLRRVRGWLTVVVVIAAAASVFGPSYRSVFLTTMILTSGTVLIGLAAGLGIALLVSQPIKGRAIYRTLLIWPFAVSPPIAGILFFVMFDPLTGIAGHVFEALTPWDMPNYRTDPVLARGLVIMASVWKTLGFTILFYIAGLQNVSTNMLEAARLDGANGWQRLRYFIVPSLTPITFFLVVTNVTYAFFEIFGTISYLTEGGPSGATVDAMTSVVQSSEWVGDGAARSLVLFVMVLAVTAWQFRATGRRVHYGG
ncbi:sugar ABC transporter permease [Phytomonospora sp. NPDC050363]|uniref:carbohydrate ABC transporter permease n=1 Tax=Phytomonospora sp. NPDC050363 TaxID=3155642 RepID=UPI00340086EE